MNLSKTLFIVALVTLNVLLVPTFSAPIEDDVYVRPTVGPDHLEGRDPMFPYRPHHNKHKGIFVGPIDEHIEARDPMIRPPGKHKEPVYTGGPIIDHIEARDPIVRPPHDPKRPTPTRVITPHVVRPGLPRRIHKEPVYSILPIEHIKARDPMFPYRPSHNKHKGVFVGPIDEHIEARDPVVRPPGNHKDPTPTRVITPHVERREAKKGPIYSILPIITPVVRREAKGRYYAGPFRPDFPEHHKGSRITAGPVTT